MSRLEIDLMHEKTLCSARRRNGNPCGNPPMNGSSVCRMHGGAAPQVRRRAEQRILEASDKAAATLVRIMQDTTIAPALQIAAARDLLDRAGLSGKQTLEIGLTTKATWEHVMDEILVDVMDNEDIVDAEVVEDDPQAEAQRDRADELKAAELARARKRAARRSRPTRRGA
jgi:hypothetical protein